jgi:hypothetical protein
MRAARLLLTIAIAGAVAVLPTGSARAGGAAFLFSQPFYLTAERVSAMAQIEIGTQANVADGPWFAHLVTKDVRYYTSEALRNSVPIGRVEITRGTCLTAWVAHVSFTVPDVPTGHYSIMVCNARCDQGVGDLAGGWIYVAHSREEGRLLVNLTNARWWNNSLRASLHQLRRRVRTLRLRLATIVSQLEQLSHRQLAVAAATEGRTSPGDSEFVVGFAAGLGTFLLLVMALVRRARRRHLVKRATDIQTAIS